MKNKDIITKIAVSQTFGTHQIVIGEDFKPLSKTALPFRTIDNRPVFLRGHNAFNLTLNFNIRKVYKWGQYYDPYLMDGMPPIGGTIKLYVDTSVDGWYILWTATKLDTWIFDETSMPTEYTVMSWTPRENGDSFESAGYRMFSAIVLSLDCVEGDSWYCDWYEDEDYRNYTEYSARGGSSERPETVFASIRDTVYKDPLDLEQVLNSSPHYLKKFIKDRAKFKN